MDQFKVIEVKESIFKNNNERATLFRNELKKDKIFLINLMSSPGSGKTTTLVRTINSLKDQFRFGVMEADIDGECDAHTIKNETGARVIQLHTGGMCHLDADMTKDGLTNMGKDNLDCVVLENIGNLVCPAEFDTGSSKNVMILSVPEGDDKPLKYPLMFSVCDVVLINKIDTKIIFDFNFKECESRIHKLNPNCQVIPISSKTGEGYDKWLNWLKENIKKWREE